MEKFKKDDCIGLLISKAEALKAAGEDRYPKRADFSPEEVCAIKAFLGPWPRALEAAGLKPERDGERARRMTEKRIRAKRNRHKAIKEKKEDE